MNVVVNKLHATAYHDHVKKILHTTKGAGEGQAILCIPLTIGHNEGDFWSTPMPFHNPQRGIDAGKVELTWILFESPAVLTLVGDQ